VPPSILAVILLTVIALGTGPPVPAQPQPPPSAQLEEMKKLDFLVGQWKGGAFQWLLCLPRAGTMQAVR